MTHLTINGNELYHERSGAGDPLLLLHGGFCSLESLRPYGDALAADFTVVAYERPGHGRSRDVDGPYGYDAALADAVAYLDALDLSEVDVVGYSDGAIIGLLLALRHPERVRSLVSISANLDPSGFTSAVTGDAGTDAGADAHAAPGSGAEPAAALELEPEPDPELAAYRTLSPDGPEHADVVLAKLFRLWTTEPRIGPDELAAVTAPTLVMSADGDSIRVDHSQLIASSIPGARLCIVPGTTHGLVAQKPELILALIRDFHAEVRAEHP